MEQIVLNVEDKKMLSSLKQVLGNMSGVTIVSVPKAMKTTAYGNPKSTPKRRKTGLELAIEDVRKGRVSRAFASADELCQHLGI